MHLLLQTQMNAYHQMHHDYLSFVKAYPDNYCDNKLMFLNGEDVDDFIEIMRLYLDGVMRPLMILNTFAIYSHGRKCYMIGNLSYCHMVLYISEFKRVYRNLMIDKNVTPEEIRHRDASGRTLFEVTKIKIPKPYFPHDPEKRFYGCLLILALQEKKDKEYERMLVEVFNSEYLKEDNLGKYFYNKLCGYYWVGLAMAFVPLGLSSWVTMWILDQVVPGCPFSEIYKIKTIDRIRQYKTG